MNGSGDEVPADGGSRWVQAAYWVDTLEKSTEADVAPEQLRAFSTWVRAAGNVQAYDEVSRLVADRKRYRRRKVPTAEQMGSDSYEPSISVEEWLSGQTTQGHVRPAVRRAWFLALAAALTTVALAPLLVSRIAAMRAPAEWTHVYETPLRARQEFVLPDGSTIIAAGLTRLSVRYTQTLRSITIDQGEALFQVEHNRLRPFRVYAGPGRITAVGTAFDVRRDGPRTSVAVTEGSVEVRPAVGSESGGNLAVRKRADPAFWFPVRVERGQRMSYEDDGHATAVEHADLQATGAWRDGQLRFERERLRSVVQAVNRYSHKHIVIDDPAAGDYLYSGTVMQDQTDEWILGLERIFPVRISKQEDGNELHLSSSSHPQH